MMTAHDAIMFLCEEKRVQTHENNKIKMTIQFRIDWLERNVPDVESWLNKMLRHRDMKFVAAGHLPTLDMMAECNGESAEQLRHEADLKFRELMNNVNIYRDFLTDNPRLYSGMMALGGWKQICMSTLDEHKFMQKKFADAYQSCEVAKTKIHPQYGLPIDVRSDAIKIDYENKTQIEHSSQEKRIIDYVRSEND